MDAFGTCTTACLPLLTVNGIVVLALYRTCTGVGIITGWPTWAGGGVLKWALDTEGLELVLWGACMVWLGRRAPNVSVCAGGLRDPNRGGVLGVFGVANEVRVGVLGVFGVWKEVRVVRLRVGVPNSSPGGLVC